MLIIFIRAVITGMLLPILFWVFIVSPQGDARMLFILLPTFLVPAFFTIIAAAVLVGLPLTMFLVRYRLESGGIYVAAGAGTRAVLAVVIMFVMPYLFSVSASGGVAALLCLLALCMGSGAATGFVWGHDRMQRMVGPFDGGSPGR